MKYAVIALLVLAPGIATVAVAQEGGGHGPPNMPVIVPSPTTLPTQPVPTGSSKSLSAHVGTSVEEMAPVISDTRQSRKRGRQPA